MIGRGPQRHAEFVEQTQMLRTYLRGETVRLGEAESRLEWLDAFPAFTPVPLEVMASGPRSLQFAGRTADRILLGVGAAPERVGWAIDQVDAGLAESGR